MKCLSDISQMLKTTQRNSEVFKNCERANANRGAEHSAVQRLFCPYWQAIIWRLLPGSTYRCYLYWLLVLSVVLSLQTNRSRVWMKIKLRASPLNDLGFVPFCFVLFWICVSKRTKPKGKSLIPSCFGTSQVWKHPKSIRYGMIFFLNDWVGMTLSQYR